MNKLTPERRAAVVKCLVEGNSIRATVRMTGAAKNTVAKLLVDLGRVCHEYQAQALQGLQSERVQCDEIWSFIGCKQANLKPGEKGDTERGDVWTWTALDADSKLMICWSVGPRDAETGCEFIADLKSRLAKRVQLTTDGLRLYVNAAEDAFGADVDYAILVKLYGEGGGESERRYSPAKCIGTETQVVQGDPDPKHISTSFVERQNLTMRMCMRRFTRLTNAFSKKLENHAAAVALHFMYYNFARPHQTLSKPYPKTPAMAAGVTDHVWKVEEVVALLGSN